MVCPDPDNENAPPNPMRAQTTQSEAALRRALKKAPQDLWLDTVRRTTGDRHQRLLYWMLCQPECDFAVAASAFYRSNPLARILNPKPLTPRPGPTNLFALVLLNWDTGSFRTQNLRVDDKDVDPAMLVRMQDAYHAHARGSLPFNIPPALLDPKGGIAMHVPAHLSPEDAPQLWPLYRHLGLRVPIEPPGMKRKLGQAKDLLRKVGIAPTEGRV